MVERFGKKRITDDVRGRIRGRQCGGDDEVGGGEPEQTENEGLAAPPWQQLLEHRDAALPVRAVLGHSPVDRQRAEERQENEDEGRDRREKTCGEKGDAWLVSEGGEVIDPGEAHDLPPIRLVNVPDLCPDRLAKALEEPAIEPDARTGRRCIPDVHSPPMKNSAQKIQAAANTTATAPSVCQ